MIHSGLLVCLFVQNAASCTDLRGTNTLAILLQALGIQINNGFRINMADALKDLHLFHPFILKELLRSLSSEGYVMLKKETKISYLIKIITNNSLLSLISQELKPLTLGWQSK